MISTENAIPPRNTRAAVHDGGHLKNESPMWQLKACSLISKKVRVECTVMLLSNRKVSRDGSPMRKRKMDFESSLVRMECHYCDP